MRQTKWLWLILSGTLAMMMVIAAALHGCGSSSAPAARRIESQNESLAAASPRAYDAPTPDVPQLDLGSVLEQGRGGGREPSPLSAYSDDFTPGVQSRRATASPRSLNLATTTHPAPGTEVREVHPGPAEFVLKPGQELWIIERAPQGDRWHPRHTHDDYPGSGTLMTRWHHPGEPAEREVPVPLAHTDVRASIAGPIASVTLTQKFHNPYAGKIEALYLFPLPDDAAVNDFLMTIGGRTIRGVIREREEARQIYDAAKARGHHASLLSQERSNIFTQRVANIEPNETIDVSITYFHTLGYRDGAYEFVFPMVVGPRFHAGMSALRAGSPDTSIDTQYLRPHERSGHDVSINVAIDAAVPIESVESPSHAVAVNTDPINPGRASVTLAAGGGGTIPNRDFILRYRLGGDRIKGGLITHSDERGGYFCFTLVPPDDLRYSVRGPIELVFVVDCSGSMEGQPLALARRAVTQALAQLRPDDTFQVIRFSDTATFMTDRPVAASPFNIRVASDFVANLRANGGTVMLTGLEPALEARGDWDRTRFVCLLSDGLLDNEPEVLRRLSKRLGDSRVFSIGIGAAPNRALLNAMARIGRGAAAYIATEPEADETMNLFIERVSTAAMTNLKIDWGSLDVTDVYPKRLPDLYTGRPVTITGRYKNPTTRAVHEVKVTGRVGDRREALVFPIKAAGVREAAPALPMVWARARIQELDEYAGWGATPGTGSTAGPNKREIRDLALRYGLLSAHTSFIAVDSDHRTGGTYGTTVPVPVNMPQGMRYESTGGYER